MQNLFAASRFPVLLLFLLPLLAQAWVKTYDYPADAPISEFFRVKVNGEQAFVYQNPIGSILAFEMEGEVALEIEYHYLVKYAVVRPLSAGVQPSWEDQTIRLTLTEPGKLSLELNGLLENPLFIFAHARLSPPRSAGGQWKVFEGGKNHHIGVMRLRGGDRVFLAGGAVVHGAFLAEDARDITIAGPGIIEASGGDTLAFPPGYRSRVVSLLDCQEVTLRDFCISDGRRWEVVPNRCQDVTISGIQIVSNDGGDDGIDIMRSSAVRILGCFIHTKDDCIAIKAASPDSLLRASHDIEIHDCVFWNTEWGNGFEIGFELRSERIYDITLRDCDFIHVEKGAVLSIHNADFATVEDVLFEDIRVEDARQKLLDFAILWTWFSLDAPRTRAEWERRYQGGGVWDNVMNFDPGEKQIHARNRGQIRNITVRNLQIVDGGLPFSIMQGFDADHLVRDVLLENIQLYGKRLTTPQALRLTQAYASDIHLE